MYIHKSYLASDLQIVILDSTEGWKGEHHVQSGGVYFGALCGELPLQEAVYLS
jgi:hypothetical protein